MKLKKNIRKLHRKTKKKIIGGSDENLVFVCTTLYQESTLSRNFYEINTYIRRYFFDTFNTYIVYKLTPFDSREKIQSYYLKEKLEENKYTIMQPDSASYVYDVNIIDFINAEHTYGFFKVIVFTQCNNSLGNILGEGFNYKTKGFEIYNVILKNAFSLYQKLDNDGLIFNIYYPDKRPDTKVSGHTYKAGYDDGYTDGSHKNEISLKSFEESYSSFNLAIELPLFLFCVSILNLLFEQIKKGIYKKRSITKDEFEGESERIKAILITDMIELFENIKQQTDLTYQKTLYKTYISRFVPNIDESSLQFKILNIIDKIYQFKILPKPSS